LHHEQLTVWADFIRFKESFLPFYRLADHHGLLRNRKEKRSAEVMFLCTLSLSVCIKACLLGKNTKSTTTTRRNYTGDLEAAGRFAQHILDQYPERRTVTLEPGTIPPLYIAAHVLYGFPGPVAGD
jgi:hypothetical protein